MGWNLKSNLFEFHEVVRS